MSRVIAVTATALVLIDALAIVLLVSGAVSTVRLGFRIIRRHDVFGAAEIGALLSAIIVVSVWRHRALRSIAITTGVSMLLVALTLYASAGKAALPLGDQAVLESYTLLATEGKLLVGPYSRFGWHHPGPLYFWLAAPFYALANHHTGALIVSVLATNTASIVTIAWVAVRYASPPLTLALILGVVGYVWRIDGMVFHFWNPYVPVLPAMALTCVCGAVAAGGARLIPLAALLASFIAQTHVALAPYAFGVTAVAVATCLGRDRGERHTWDLATPARRTLNLTAWLLAILWIGPIAEQLTGTPGNITELWRFFTADHAERPGWATAYVAWADNVAGVLLPEFRFLSGRFVPSSATWPLVFAAAETVLLLPATLYVMRKGRRFDAAFAGILIVGLIISLWSVSRIAGEITEYSIVWISAVGALATAAVGAAAVTIVGTRKPAVMLLFQRATIVICALSTMAITLKAWSALGAADAGAGRRTRQQRQLLAAYEGLRRFMSEAQIRRPLLRMSSQTWSVAAGVGLQLQLAGLDFAVERSAVPVFTAAFASDGSEDAEVTFATMPYHSELRARPGNTVVVAADPLYVDVILLPHCPEVALSGNDRPREGPRAVEMPRGAGHAENVVLGGGSPSGGSCDAAQDRVAP